jgi:hypothetical protein
MINFKKKFDALVNSVRQQIIEDPWVRWTLIIGGSLIVVLPVLIFGAKHIADSNYKKGVEYAQGTSLQKGNVVIGYDLDDDGKIEVGFKTTLEETRQVFSFKCPKLGADVKSVTLTNAHILTLQELTNVPQENIMDCTSASPTKDSTDL